MYYGQNGCVSPTPKFRLGSPKIQFDYTTTNGDYDELTESKCESLIPLG